jgi:hypothetical protein
MSVREPSTRMSARILPPRAEDDLRGRGGYREARS